MPRGRQSPRKAAAISTPKTRALETAKEKTKPVNGEKPRRVKRTPLQVAIDGLAKLGPDDLATLADEIAARLDGGE